MNTILFMAIILILIVVATVITKKVPFNFVLLIVPIVCALILGYSVEETSTFVVEQLSSMMQSAGFMLLFAFLYFQMLTEAGVFDTIVTVVTTKLGNKMNVVVIMILTTVIGGFSILTGNFTPAYLITFPILVPLYKKFDFDREGTLHYPPDCHVRSVLYPQGHWHALHSLLRGTGRGRAGGSLHALGPVLHPGHHPPVGVLWMEAQETCGNLPGSG